MSISTDRIEIDISENCYEAATAEIERAAASGISKERCDIAVMLGDYINPHSESILIGLLSDENLNVRAEAVKSLSVFKSIKAFDLIKNSLSSVNSPVFRGNAVLCVGYNCPESERENITALFNTMLETESSDFVRTKLYCALFILGDHSAAEGLIRLYNKSGNSHKCAILNDLADMLERGVGDMEDIKAFSCVVKGNLPHMNVRGAYERLRYFVDCVYGVVVR